MRKRLKTKRIYCAVFVHHKATGENEIYCPKNQIFCCKFCPVRKENGCIRTTCVEGPCIKTFKRIPEWVNCPSRISKMEAFLLALSPSFKELEKYLYPHKKVYVGKLK